jgi:ribonuclease Z
VRADHRVPTLTWIVHRETSRLLPQYAGLPGGDIAQLRRDGVTVTESFTTPLLAVSGDTRIELVRNHPELWATKVLVFEVTAWDERRTVEEIRGWGHTHVDEMLAVCEQFTGEALVLVHRSPRHTRRDVESIVRDRFPASVRERVHVFGA